MSVEGETMRRQGLHHLTIVGGGACLCLFLLPVLGRSQDTLFPSPSCLPMREQGEADAVFLDVAKVIDIPGFVCVRVLNGFSEQILAGPQGVRLQKRKEGKKQEHSFQDFEPFPAGARLPAGAGLIPARGVVDWWLPYSKKPASPGIYRVCFSYTFPGQKKGFQEVCSQEFSLSKGGDILPLPGCPPLPEQEAVRRVSIHVGKRLDTTDFVCVRVINGLRVNIEYRAVAFWLQKWEEKEGKFLNIEEPDSRGTAVQLVAYVLSAGGVLDRYLPSSRQPVAPGRYRVRFRLRTPGQNVDEEVYSGEFSLP